MKYSLQHFNLPVIRPYNLRLMGKNLQIQFNISQKFGLGFYLQSAVQEVTMSLSLFVRFFVFLFVCLLLCAQLLMKNLKHEEYVKHMTYVKHNYHVSHVMMMKHDNHVKFVRLNV